MLSHVRRRTLTCPLAFASLLNWTAHSLHTSIPVHPSGFLGRYLALRPPSFMGWMDSPGFDHTHFGQWHSDMCNAEDSCQQTRPKKEDSGKR